MQINNITARDEWGWDGFVISDCGAINGIQGDHAYTSTPSETVAAAMNQGGVDVNCGDFYPVCGVCVCVVCGLCGVWVCARYSVVV